MRIWFDISNAPHINLFKDLIKELQSEGHEIVVTCRPLSNTVSLLDLHKIKYTIVGKHYGKNFLKKVLGYPIRVWQLKKFMHPLEVDIAISQSSFHSPVAARLLGIPSIYMNDNEYAIGNIPSFICATRILIPEFLNIKKVRKQGAKLKKIIAYPGVKEGIYLWQCYLGHEISSIPINAPQKKIYIRPEPRTAQYYKGDLNFLDDVIISLKEKFKVIILSRDQEQLKYYKTAKFAGAFVPEKPFSFNDISKDCLLFIGAGGTMTREMAVIGIPTISVYQDELLDVDEYLLKLELLQHLPKLTAEKAIQCINSNESKTPNQDLLLKGKESYYLIKSLIKEISKK
jgi:uncharacterized protein